MTSGLFGSGTMATSKLVFRICVEGSDLISMGVGNRAGSGVPPAEIPLLRGEPRWRLVGVGGGVGVATPKSQPEIVTAARAPKPKVRKLRRVMRSGSSLLGMINYSFGDRKIIAPVGTGAVRTYSKPIHLGNKGRTQQTGLL